MQQIQIAMPEALENIKLPNPELITFYKNLENRVLWIDFDIDDTLTEMSKYIIQWNSEDRLTPLEDRNPIKILIFSYGGCPDNALSFIDVIKLSKTPVITINMGVAASAGSLIFLAGHKRYVMPRSQVLIHQGSAGVQGSTTAVMDVVDNIKKTEAIIKDYILENTKIDSKLYNKKCKNEWYLNAKECLELGVTNFIINDLDDIVNLI